MSCCWPASGPQPWVLALRPIRSSPERGAAVSPDPPPEPVLWVAASSPEAVVVEEEFWSEVVDGGFEQLAARALRLRRAQRPPRARQARFSARRSDWACCRSS